jgi:23S rRNA (uracil1939-C5)-methyltransferase
VTAEGAVAGETVTIVDLDHDGRGVARLGGKVVFVPGALPGETVRIGRRRRRSGHDVAELVEVSAPAPERVTPPCAHFGVCGGCALQHLAPDAQRAAKGRELLQQLERIGKVVPDAVLAPLAGPDLAYRRRARLGVKYVAKKGRVLVGFRERESPYVTDVRRCHVLADPVGRLIEPLAAMIDTLGIRDRLPQIEVAIGEPEGVVPALDGTGGALDGAAGAASIAAAPVVVLVLRVLAPPDDDDLGTLRVFARVHGIEFWLQPGGHETAAPLDPPARPLRYALPEFGVDLEFGPLDFVQVNGELNRRMVSHAIGLLAPAPTDAVLDLYCGLGNFTLPLARRAARVFGVEGEAGLVARARANAERQGLANAAFAVADLSKDLRGESWARERWQRVLLDPPRVGAREVLPAVAASRAERVVYISCHPGSLARDAGLLVHEHGFRLAAAGVMDMFPHTAHVESIAVFEPR